MKTTTQSAITKRRLRTRSRIHGTALRPRLAVAVTNRHVTAQLIDDDAAKTLAYVTTVKAKITGNLTAKAEWVGTEIAAAAAKHKLKQVVFDRGSKIYHGRLHALATSARAAGLEF